MKEWSAKIKRYTHLFGVMVGATGILLFLLMTLSSVSAGLNESHTSTVVSSNAIPDRWRIMADMRKGRGDPGVVVFENNIYVIGGYFSPGYGYVDSLEIYEPLSDTWQIRYGIPVTKSDFMSASVGDGIYIIGGWNEDREELGLNPVLGDNQKYDPVLDTWIIRTSMITPVSGAGVVVMNDAIYIIGGNDGNNATRDVQIYDPYTNSWSLGTPLPETRAELGAVVLGGKIFAIGGVSAGTLNTVEIYDPALDNWSDGPALPEPRASMAVAVRDGKIYVVGGTDDWGTPNIKDTAFVYEPGTGMWSTTTSLPTARWATEAAVIGDLIYVIGGVGESGAGNANEAYPFDPISTTTAITADDPEPTVPNQPFTVEFVVTSTMGIPTGIVTVTVASDPGTCHGSLVDGVGNCMMALHSPGNHTLIAGYGGDEFFGTSSSDIEEHVVIPPVSYIPMVTK
jgi:N-acetylneuraminic acid mutarotase